MAQILEAATIIDDHKDERLALAKKVQGQRYINHSTRLAILVTDRLKKAVVPENMNGGDVGLCTATFGAHFDHAAKQYSDIVTQQRPLISPMLGPNNTPNATASHLAIYHQLKSFSVSFCDAGTAGTESLLYGVNAIRRNTALRVLITGVEARPQRIETKMYGPAFEELPDCAVAFLLDGEHVNNGEINIAAYARAFCPDVAQGDYYHHILRCLKNAHKQLKAPHFELNAVFLGCPEHLRGTEIKAVESVFTISKKVDFISSRLNCKSRSISGLLKLYDAVSVYKEMQKSFFTHMPDNIDITPGVNKNILINNFEPDGSMCCLLITIHA